MAVRIEGSSVHLWQQHPQVNGQENPKDLAQDSMRVEGSEGPGPLLGGEACTTCENRKYQDKSDDASVSFQTPTHIPPQQAAAMVRSHEYEHVRNEQARADREGREVVYQSVVLHGGICPDCGKPFIAGGQTRTVTRGSISEEDFKGQFLDEYI